MRLIATPRHPTRRLLIAGLLTLLLLTALLLVPPPAAEAASTGEIPAHETVIPMTPADEGGAGLSGAGASEWLPFAITLGPFLILVTGLLWMTFKIDSSEDADSDRDH